MVRRKNSVNPEVQSNEQASIPNISNDKDTCPVCKSDLFLNPNMTLLVSPCYHRVCEVCVERIFSHGSSPCPICGTMLKRSNFVIPVFEDLQVEKECRIRKRIAAVFNKREEDFETLGDYNDYLEEVEGIIFNLVKDVDVQKTNSRLEAYREQNLDQIFRNKMLQEREDEEARCRQIEEERRRLDYETQLLAELEEEDKQRRLEETRFIEELATSSNTVASLATRHRSVNREAKRKAQEAAMQKMPSFKGLKVHGRPKKEALFDPFETVPAIILPFDHTGNGFRSWFFELKVPDEKVLAAGGVRAGDICKRLLLAFCYYC